jgi:hypothetical protein
VAAALPLVVLRLQVLNGHHGLYLRWELWRREVRLLLHDPLNAVEAPGLGPIEDSLLPTLLTVPLAVDDSVSMGLLMLTSLVPLLRVDSIVVSAACGAIPGVSALLVGNGS